MNMVVSSKTGQLDRERERESHEQVQVKTPVVTSVRKFPQAVVSED